MKPAAKPEITSQRPRFFKSKLGGSGDTAPESKVVSKPSVSATKATGKMDAPAQKRTPEPEPFSEPSEKPEDKESVEEEEDLTRPRIGTAKRMSAMWEEKAIQSHTATVSEHHASRDSSPEVEYGTLKKSKVGQFYLVTLDFAIVVGTGT
jgi:hypothetical protein